MESPSGKKSNTKILLIVGAVLVVVLLIAVFYFVMQDDDEEIEELQVGDYMKYEFGGSLNGTLWLNVTAVNATTYSLTTFVSHDGINETDEPFTLNRSDGIILWNPGNRPDDTDLESQLVGTEQLSTALGTRTVKHYRNESESQISEIYVGEGTGIIYHIYIEYTYSTQNIVTASLVETNIEWV
jgi:hypothetical protein